MKAASSRSLSSRERAAVDARCDGGLGHASRSISRAAAWPTDERGVRTGGAQVEGVHGPGVVTRVDHTARPMAGDCAGRASERGRGRVVARGHVRGVAAGADREQAAVARTRRNTKPSSVTGLPRPSAPRSNDRRGPHVGFGARGREQPQRAVVARDRHLAASRRPAGPATLSANAPPGTNVPVQVRVARALARERERQQRSLRRDVGGVALDRDPGCRSAVSPVQSGSHRSVHTAGNAVHAAFGRVGRHHHDAAAHRGGIAGRGVRGAAPSTPAGRSGPRCRTPPGTRTGGRR